MKHHLPATACLALVAALIALGGCAGNSAYVEPPQAQSAAGGRTVEWGGRLIGIRMKAPRGRNVVYVDDGHAYGMSVAVGKARPEIYPFVLGRKVIFSARNPLLIIPNDAQVGDLLEGRLVVWRGADGLLHARPTEDGATVKRRRLPSVTVRETPPAPSPLLRSVPPLPFLSARCRRTRPTRTTGRIRTRDSHYRLSGTTKRAAGVEEVPVGPSCPSCVSPL